MYIIGYLQESSKCYNWQTNMNMHVYPYTCACVKQNFLLLFISNLWKKVHLKGSGKLCLRFWNKILDLAHDAMIIINL